MAIQADFLIKNGRLWDYLLPFNRSFSVFLLFSLTLSSPMQVAAGRVQVADGPKKKKKGPMRAKPGPKLENYGKRKAGTGRPTQAWAR